MSVMRKCVRCKQPVVVYRVTMGHLAEFDPSPTKNGKWWMDKGGIMRRHGRFARGYEIHARRCR